MRNRFDRELELLHAELIEMGALIETAIQNAVNGLIEKDRSLAQKAIEFEEQINEQEKQIEHRCLKLLLQQQPVAADLRLISTALKMITDMERIGDQAADISETTIRLLNQNFSDDLVYIPKMALAVIKMVNDSVDAFINKDLELANSVIKYDDVVDNFFNMVKNQIIELVRRDANNGEKAVDLLMIAKYLERIGDHAENIAGWVVFSITGVH